MSGLPNCLIHHSLSNVFLRYALKEGTHADILVRQLSFIDDIVVYVWIFLTVLMLVALRWFYNVNEAHLSRPIMRKVVIASLIVLIIATWTYPVYAPLDNLVRGLYGNYFYTALLIITLIIVSSVQRKAAFLLSLILIWLILAIIYVIAQIRVEQSRSEKGN